MGAAAAVSSVGELVVTVAVRGEHRASPSLIRQIGVVAVCCYPAVSLADCRRHRGGLEEGIRREKKGERKQRGDRCSWSSAHGD